MDPDTGMPLPADEYLSGDVGGKLDHVDGLLRDLVDQPEHARVREWLADNGLEDVAPPCPSNDAGRNSPKPGHGRAPPTRSTRTSPWSKPPGSPTCSKNTDTASRGPSPPCSWMAASPAWNCSGKTGTRNNPRATTCSTRSSTTAGQAMTKERPTVPCACCTRPFRPIPRPSTTRSSPRSSTPAASNEVRHATR